jgi:hypothetical protein
LVPYNTGGEVRVFVLILVIGVGLLIYGIYLLALRIKFIPMSKAITGTVIDLHETSTRRNGRAYFPVIEYYDPETNRIESFEHNVGSGRSAYNVGDSLELRYYSDGDRKLVLVNSWSGIWGTLSACIIAGIVFIIFGLLMR